MKSYMVSQTNPEHPTDELLIALVHEQSFDDAAAIRGHVAACAACTARSRDLAANDAVVAALLASLDHPLARARRSFNVRNARRFRRAALVAGALATMAGAAAALVPSSPLHRWIAARVAPEPVVRTSEPATSPLAQATAPVTEGALASGIAIPAQATLLIEFRREQQTGTVEIGRSAVSDVVFRSRGGTTAYEVAEGRVSIDNQTPAETYLIEIPATVRQVRIRVGTRTLIRWPEDSVKFSLPNEPRLARLDLRPQAATTP